MAGEEDSGFTMAEWVERFAWHPLEAAKEIQRKLLVVPREPLWKTFMKNGVPVPTPPTLPDGQMSFEESY